jgi:hypothetical protein
MEQREWSWGASLPQRRKAQRFSLLQSKPKADQHLAEPYQVQGFGAVLYGQRSFARGNFIVPENHRYHAAYLPHESIRRKRQLTQRRSRLLKEQDGASLRRAKPATRSVKRAAEAKKKTISQAVQKKD